MNRYEGLFPDQRLAKRAACFADAMAASQDATISRIADDWAEQMSFYRFLRNPNVALEALKAALVRQCQSNADPEPHKLVIQDTTQLNYQAVAKRTGGALDLGVIGDNESRGFFLHPSFVVEAKSGHGLGFCQVHTWSRPVERPDKHERGYRRLPIEEKESYRWIASAKASRERLAGPLTHVTDREGDIYELFSRLPDAKTHVLVRSSSDRRIDEQPGRLSGYLAAQPVLGRYQAEVRQAGPNTPKTRTACFVVRAGRVRLRRPDRRAAGSDPERTAVWAVEVKEADETAPDETAPIHWRLLTTHPVKAFAEAKQVVEWYMMRWQIEQVFRLLKSEGLDLEASRLESGGALLRLGVLALGAALDVMRLLLARGGASWEQPIGHVFSEGERRCLQEVARRVEGATDEQQNPHAEGTLAWAGWIVARLGGWNGYQSQGPPGPTTFHRGLRRFASVFEGWQVAHEVVYNG